MLPHPHPRRRAVFLDRDGVLNCVVIVDGVAHPPAELDAVTILPGVQRACHKLKDLGYLLLIITNQPDVARGTQSREMVEAINGMLLANLPIDGLQVCWHDNADNCHCRKPKPGMIFDAQKAYDLTLEECFVVGDRWSDVEAGRQARCRTFLVDRPYSKSKQCRPDFVVNDLVEASEIIARLTPKP